MHHEIEKNIHNLLESISKHNKEGKFNTGNIIAVSKKKSFEDIKIAHSNGLKNFGENYAQELEKKNVLSKKEGLDLKWHFIGPIQTNKIKSIAKCAAWVHSVNRKKEVDILNKECLLENKIMDILVQVNISNETTKSGLLPEELLNFSKYIVEEKKNLSLRGMMVMPALNKDSSETIKVFNQCKDLHQTLINKYPFANILSMGTTSDYLNAIDCGSSMIRIGELIFGKRS